MEKQTLMLAEKNVMMQLKGELVSLRSQYLYKANSVHCCSIIILSVEVFHWLFSLASAPYLNNELNVF